MDGRWDSHQEVFTLSKANTLRTNSDRLVDDGGHAAVEDARDDEHHSQRQQDEAQDHVIARGRLLFRLRLDSGFLLFFDAGHDRVILPLDAFALENRGHDQARDTQCCPGQHMRGQRLDHLFQITVLEVAAVEHVQQDRQHAQPERGPAAVPELLLQSPLLLLQNKNRPQHRNRLWLR